jgi:hypothetical protein
MCTVTYLPFSDRVLITSNRDEATLRTPASHPLVANVNTGKILFPKDGLAGGTWIGMHSNGHVMVLLNGAFQKHKHQPPYRKSRGLIFIDILDSHEPVNQFQSINLQNIEPFTLVIWYQSTLWEAKWNGTEKFLQPITTDEPHIWSSVTLYDPEVVEKRENWFQQWLIGRQNISSEEIVSFHEFAGDGDAKNDLKMNRNGLLQTVSITGMEIREHSATMTYKELLDNTSSVHDWQFSNISHLA